MLFEILKDCRNFASDLASRPYKATNLYAVTPTEDDDEFPRVRFLIPDGLNIHNSPTFTRVIIVYVEELSPKVPLGALAKIANDLSEETIEEKAARDSGSISSRISQTVYVFLIGKMLGTFHSRRRGNDIFLFFNTSKLTEIQIRHRLYKILGRLFLKRAKGIVESTYEKIGKEPFGYLAEIVEFFNRIGEKLLKKAMRYFTKVEGHLPKRLKEYLKRLARSRMKFWPNINNAIRRTFNGVKLDASKLHRISTTNLNKIGIKSNSIFSCNIGDAIIDDRLNKDVDDHLSSQIDKSRNIESG